MAVIYIPFKGSVLGDIALTDNGDAAPSALTVGNTVHTYNSQTSTGPVTILAITWPGYTIDLGCCATEDDIASISSVTWGGNAMTPLVGTSAGAGDALGVACKLYIYNGALSGNIVVTFDAGTADSEITKISLSNVSSITPIDTDAASEESGDGAVTLSALASPGTGGIRVCVYGASADAASSVSWTNGTEIADVDAGTFQHSVAYDLGADSGSITADGNSGNSCIAGVSIR